MLRWVFGSLTEGLSNRMLSRTRGCEFEAVREKRSGSLASVSLIAPLISSMMTSFLLSIKREKRQLEFVAAI